MNFRVVVAHGAARRLTEQLPEAVAAVHRRVHLRCTSRRSPQGGTPLRKPFEGQWRARGAKYRIRYRIDEGAQTIYVLDVDNRRDVYRG